MAYRAKNVSFNISGFTGGLTNSGILYTVPTSNTARITFMTINTNGSGISAILKVNSTSTDQAGRLVDHTTNWSNPSTGVFNLVDWGIYLNAGDYISFTYAGTSLVANVFISLIEEY